MLGKVLILVTLATLSYGLRTETLIFEDEFDFLDFNKWKHEITLSGYGNWEFELYWNNRTTSFVKDGKLVIQPGLTADWIGENNVRAGYTMNLWGSTPADYCTANEFYGCERTSGAGGNFLNPITSARLSQKFSFKYGRVEVNAKLPQGDWLWPAIWMLPAQNAYGNWPASGEIDIVESRGNVGYPAGGPESIGSTLHFGPGWPYDPYEKAHAEYKLTGTTFADGFHTFGLYWDENEIYTYVDQDSNRVLDLKITEDFWKLGEFPSNVDNPWQYAQNTNAPFDQEFYLILNVAVGGTNGYFPDGVGSKPWSNTSTHAVNEFYNAKGAWYPTWQGNSDMQVDWVKVWSVENSDEEPDFLGV